MQSIKLSIILLLLLNSNLFSKYTPVNITQNELLKNEKRYGIKAKKRLILWDQMLQRVKNKTILIQLKIVNAFFNKIRCMSDEQVWKKKDYWATPMEFLAVGAGDCEDFAIAKYFSLLKLGISKKKLKITYTMLQKKESKKAHIVLNYIHKSTSIPIVLDNYDKKIRLITKRDDLKTIYSFSAASIIEKMRIPIV